eukprot:1012865-Rhodomonas_salina.2
MHAPLVFRDDIRLADVQCKNHCSWLEQVTGRSQGLHVGRPARDALVGTPAINHEPAEWRSLFWHSADGADRQGLAVSRVPF